MKIPMFSGIALLGWQLLAAGLSAVAHFDLLLSAAPDPAWYVTLYAALLQPPRWLVVSAVLLGLGLVWWGLSLKRRQNAE